MATVNISVGQNIQNVIDANPAGTTYQLASGIHRMQTLVPKTGDIFTGIVGSRPTSILSGARLLEGSWKFYKNYWYIEGQTQAGTVTEDLSNCLPGYPRCRWPEDLFMNNEIKLHVAALVDVIPGTWFFDYTTDTIYVGDDPRDKTVETSVTPKLVITAGNDAEDVIFEHLIIEKYATPTADGAIGLGNSALGAGGWEIRRCEVRYNHGGGIWNDSNTATRFCYVHHNGNFGLVGAGANIIIEGNEISYNNTVGYDTLWGSGGSKWVYTTDLIVKGNWSHHNIGPGFWTDINNVDTLYEDNLVEYNTTGGIYHEISYEAIIRNNLVRYNGTGQAFPYYTAGAGIEIYNSRGVEIYGNTVIENWQGITGLNQNRGTGNDGVWELESLYVHDNIIVSLTQPAGGGRTGYMIVAGSPAIAVMPVFEDNVYTIVEGAEMFFNAVWDSPGDDLNLTEWQGLGHDN